MQQAIDTVLFDFFGVIYADPLKNWLEDRGHEKNEHHEETARLLDTGAIGYDEYVQRLANISGEPAKDLYSYFHSTTLLNEPIVTTISQLKPSYRVGLLSNTCTEEITPLLEANGLKPLFDVIVISSETGYAKPDPEIFQHTLEKLSAKPKQTVFIDDSQRNINAARSLNMHTVHYKAHEQMKKDLSSLGVTLAPKKVKK